MHNNTLVTFLGKGRENNTTGYRRATYRFPDGNKHTTAFFGLELARFLDVETLAILGTRASQWGVLIENLVSEGNQEELRIRIMDAETEGRITQELLDEATELISASIGVKVVPRLISYGQAEKDQYDILGLVAEAVPNGGVHFDVTHGFRHLGMVGFESAFMLERVRNLKLQGIWYGALDMMTEDKEAPVVKLDGLVHVRRWVDALDRFDATGDYGVFAPLLERDGVEADKAACLAKAAFFERNYNLRDAERALRTFLPSLDDNLAGASSLFQKKLRERLRWIDQPDYAAKQKKLAFLYLNRDDFVRAAALGWEAFITKECLNRGRDPNQFTDEERRGVDIEIKKEIDNDKHPPHWAQAYKNLSRVRNALAHATTPADPRMQPILQQRDKLKQIIEQSIQRLFSPRPE